MLDVELETGAIGAGLATILEDAASGVSEMTVSRVLRNRGDVSDATRAKVLEAAKELGYVPNKIAGALASQRVNLVAVIIPSLSNLVFPKVLSTISDEPSDERISLCTRSGISLLTSMTTRVSPMAERRSTSRP